jgi:hypothetical protein
VAGALAFSEAGVSVIALPQLLQKAASSGTEVPQLAQIFISFSSIKYNFSIHLYHFTIIKNHFQEI